MAILDASASASQSLTATSDATINNMSLSPDAGDYLAFFTMEVLHPTDPVTDGEQLYVSLYVNGSQVTNSERWIEASDSITGNEILVVACGQKVTVGASQTVDVRYRLVSGTQAWTAARRSLTLLPASSIQEVTSNTNDTLASATYTTINGMSITPGAGDYFALFIADASSNTSNDVIAISLFIDSTQQTHTERTFIMEPSFTSQQEYPCVIAARVQPTAGQAVNVRWQRQSGSGTMVVHTRALTLVPCDSGDVLQATAIDTINVTNTSPAAISGMALPNPAADDWLAIYTGIDNYASGGPNTEYTMYVGGSETTTTHRTQATEASFDGMDWWRTHGGKVTTNGSQNVEAYWWADATNTRTGKERTLVIVREGAGVTTNTKTVNISAVLEKSLTKTVNISAVLQKTVTSTVTFDAVLAGLGVDLEGYRWRDDDGSEITASWFKPQDHVHSGAVSTNTRLRIIVNTNGSIPANAWQLEYRRQNTDPWFRVIKDE